ncbi:hypothetical protein HDU76_007790 [Blyttiomyces sp. JEL0837]|nr:hypothetical protein HDU76_007790 [Blyttiomyces sp. JEL0837]
MSSSAVPSSNNNCGGPVATTSISPTETRESGPLVVGGAGVCADFAASRMEARDNVCVSGSTVVVSVSSGTGEASRAIIRGESASGMGLSSPILTSAQSPFGGSTLSTVNITTHQQQQQQQKRLTTIIKELERREIQSELSAGIPQNEIKARVAVRFALRNCEKLDAYFVERILGFGANGVVFSAHTRTSPTTYHVAIKIIYKDLNSQQQSQSQQQQHHLPPEITVLRHLSHRSKSHPNVLKRLTDFQDDRHFYLVTEASETEWTSVSIGNNNNANGGDSMDSDGGDVSPFETQPLIFFNPRMNRYEKVSVSQGCTDLYAWSTAVWSEGQNWLASQQQVNGMEVDGITRQQQQQQQPKAPLPDRESCREIFRQVAFALRHLHENGIVHGDVKEENVLLSWKSTLSSSSSSSQQQQPSEQSQPTIVITPPTTPTSISVPQDQSSYFSPSPSPTRSSPPTTNVHVTLADFGHARLATQTIPIHLPQYGTPELTSPECLLIQNHPNLTNINVWDAKKTDIFALGILLFALRHGPGEIPAAARAVGGLWSGNGGEAGVGKSEKGGVGVGGVIAGGMCPVRAEKVYRAFFVGDGTSGGRDGMMGYPLEDVDERVAVGDRECLDLLRGMLCPDPRFRLSAAEVCGHPWVVGGRGN